MDEVALAVWCCVLRLVFVVDLEGFAVDWEHGPILALFVLMTCVFVLALSPLFIATVLVDDVWRSGPVEVAEVGKDFLIKIIFEFSIWCGHHPRSIGNLGSGGCRSGATGISCMVSGLMGWYRLASIGTN